MNGLIVQWSDTSLVTMQLHVLRIECQALKRLSATSVRTVLVQTRSSFSLSSGDAGPPPGEELQVLDALVGDVGVLGEVQVLERQPAQVLQCPVSQLWAVHQGQVPQTRQLPQRRQPRVCQGS